MAEESRKDILQWHPAFYAGIQIELQEEAENLIFENEHQLGTKPMEIDVLIIKKAKDLPIQKNIGRIFRKYNIVEYKSPPDYLSIDDFYIVTKKLSESENLWLKSLTNHLEKPETAERLLTEYKKHKDNVLYDSILSIIMNANQKKFQEVKNMFDALRDLMKEELDAARNEGQEYGLADGIRALIETCGEFGLSKDETCEKVCTKFNLSKIKANDYMDQFWKSFNFSK